MISLYFILIYQIIQQFFLRILKIIDIKIKKQVEVQFQ